MQVPLVMTVIGKDRTGLVETLAEIVAGHGGNWLESRMCRLGGEFAGILPHSCARRTAGGFDARPQGPGVARSERGRANRRTAGRRRGRAAHAAGDCRPRPSRHHPRNQPGACRARRQCGGIVQRMRERGDVRGGAVQGARAAAASGWLRFRALGRELEKIATDLVVDISLAELEGVTPAR